MDARPLKAIPHPRHSTAGFIFNFFACLHVIFRSFGILWALRREEKHPILQHEPVDYTVNLPESEPGLKDRATAQKINESVLNPCCQRLQHLEQLVTDLLNKPSRIPLDKEQTILESLTRIKAIEYDLQKTKKVKSGISTC